MVTLEENKALGDRAVGRYSTAVRIRNIKPGGWGVVNWLLLIEQSV